MPAIIRASLDTATSIEAADVYKSGLLAATLERTAAGVHFSYRPEYLAANGSAIASTLPVGPEAIISPSGAVPAFFAGLLPEGRRLSSLRRAVKTSADDELSLLLAVGSDPVGDVQVVPHGQVPQPPPPLIDVDQSFEEVDFSRVLADSGVVDAVALAGVQDKASAGMISVPAGRSGRRYILKVDPPEHPGVVLDEAFFMQVAASAGLEVARSEVVHDVKGRAGLLVERFDRVPTAAGAWTTLAVEDGAQVLGIYPADKYRTTAEAVATAMANLCPARTVALRALYAQFCFAWLTGNGDLHAKNLSLLAVPGGERRVSPVYDIPSTLFYGDQTLALTIQGKNRGLSRRLLLAFASDIGLPERAATLTLEEILRATADLPERLTQAALPFSDQAIRTTLRSLRDRRRMALGR